jgi:hypothetical protein
VFYLALFVGLTLINPASVFDGYLWIGFLAFAFGWPFVGFAMLYLTIPSVDLAPVWVLLLAIGGFLAGGLLKKHLTVERLFVLFLFLVIVDAVSISPTLRNYLSTNPPKYQYTHDMGLYMKTYYLMEDQNYYKAHAEAFMGHNVPGLPNDVWGWRLPTVFYIWRLLPGSDGSVIWFGFLGLVLMVLYGVFDMSRTWAMKLKKGDGSWLGKFATRSMPILSPLILWPYFHFALRDWTILQVEWWAMCFILLGFWQYFKKNFVWATVLFSIGLSIRELLLIPFLVILGIYVLVWLVKKFVRIPDIGMLRSRLEDDVMKKSWWVFALPVVVFFILISVHTYFVSLIVELGGNPFRLRFHGEGLGLFMTSFAFGSWEYLLFKFRPFLVVYFLSGLGLLWRLSWRSLVLLSFYLLPVSFLFIGTSSWNHVWGVLFVPVVLVGVSSLRA